jgi:hypothetical protein
LQVFDQIANRLYIYLIGATGFQIKEGKKMATKYNAGDEAPSNRKALDSYGDLCTECGKKLGKNPLYFEVNTSWEVIVPGSDHANSQGCFPIGSTCANKFASGLLIKMGA